MKGKILVGWGARDVTPSKKVSLRGQFYVRISRKVNDPLTTTALALEAEDGSSQAIIVSLDAVFASEFVTNGCRKVLENKLPDFDTSKLFISATHTHTAPGQPGLLFGDGKLPDDVMSEEKYGNFLIEKISEAAVEAWNSRKVGAVSWGKGHAVVGFNRRMSYFDGSSVMYGKSNVPEFSHVEGYENHGVDMLFTYDANHNLTGMVVNVPCPSQCTEGSYFVSSDYWHETRQEIRKRHGEGLYILPQCSAAGDQAPRTMVDRRADERMLKLKGYKTDEGLGSDYDAMRRQDIADKIASAVDDVLPVVASDIRDEAEFDHEVLNIDLKQRTATIEDLKIAKTEVANWQAKLDELKDTDPTSVEYSIAYKRLGFNQKVIDMHEAQQRGISTTPVELHCLRLGDIAMCTNRFEYYIDYGVRIKARSKAVQTFVVQLAGEGTYLPTERSLEGGSYGAYIASTPIGPEGGQQIVEAEVNAINKMFEPKIGIQLYSVREALAEDFKGTLKELSKLGFQGVEFAFNYGGLTPSELAEFLKENNLQAIGIYENLDNICNPEAEVYKQAEALGCRHLTFGFGIIQLEEDFDKCLDMCHKAVKVAASKGLTICYHAHAHEFKKLNGEYYLDLLLNAEGLETMAFEADTCWIQQGGENIVGYMRKYANRIPLLHVKDVTAEGQITELGNGLIDFKAVADFAKENNIPWLSYEQDISSLPGLDSAVISIKHLKSCI
jgi:sugar phosphate isomerase/epimerase